MKEKMLRYTLVVLLLTASQFLQAQSDPAPRKRGKVTAYYPDSKQRAYSGKYKNYKREGVWTYWNRSGWVTKTETYHNGLREGVTKEYLRNGDLRVVENYKNNVLDGKRYSYYHGGKTETEFNYVDGKKQGEQLWWYENGNLWQSNVFDNNELVSKHTYYFNSRPKEVEYYANGKKTGTWRSYPDPSMVNDSFPSTVTQYKNGKNDGYARSYRNGVLISETYFTEGTLNGTTRKWDYSGNMTMSANYRNGKKDGLFRYFESGVLTFEGAYKDDVPMAKHSNYDRITGKLHTEEYFIDGRSDSLINYHPNGIAANKRWFTAYQYDSRGFPQSRMENYAEWNEQGVLLQKGQFINDRKNGEWWTYYPDGKKKSVTRYEYGQIVGLYEKWYSNGKKMIELDCYRNNVMQSPKAWNEKGVALKANTSAYNDLVDSNKPGEVYNDPRRYRNRHEDIMFAPVETIVAERDEELISDRVVDATQEGWEDGIVEAPEPDVIREDQIFTVVEEQPEFPGGNDAMRDFIAKNIKYPPVERESGKQGRVYVRFVVRKDGQVDDIKVVKGVDGAPGFSAEAIRIVDLMPDWKPGKQNGRPVNCYMTLPIRFVLD